ncbi:hypothetical protein HMPREF1556_00569 [Porphyromonas sp. oral taxon 278 str. W7784]|nr:hypothetical protein HMPREF1556_00569 [Porphyromonas sp. oral taxon 278 str. W7784]
MTKRFQEIRSALSASLAPPYLILPPRHWSSGADSWRERGVYAVERCRSKG